MEIKKNTLYIGTVTDITNDGSGVCKLDGYTVFVPYTAIGDTIEFKLLKANKSYGFGKVERILTASDAREENTCAAFYTCGGCSFRHLTYPAELAVKQGFVENAFRRIGKLDAPIETILPSEQASAYRNKAQYPFGTDKDGRITAGFYAKRSHRVIPCADCALQPPIFGAILNTVVAFANAHALSAYDEQSGSGLLRNLYLRRSAHSGEVLVCLVVKKALPDKMAKALVDCLTTAHKEISGITLNINPKNTNVILGERYLPLYGKQTMTDTVCGVSLDISPAAFFQVNRAQAERLYSIAKDYAGLDGTQTLIDLYCGTGAIGLAMADGVQHLIGAEIVSAAVENARENARKNGIGNAEFICADAGQAAAELHARGIAPDVVVVDPPRKGCGIDCVTAVAKMRPARVVMISCNPATAARDCADFKTLGYKTVKIKPVDMFPRTTHVECVVLLERVEDK